MSGFGNNSGPPKMPNFNVAPSQPRNNWAADPLHVVQHHPGRQDGPTIGIPNAAHDILHSAEISTIKSIGGTTNGNNWTAGARNDWGGKDGYVGRNLNGIFGNGYRK